MSNLLKELLEEAARKKFAVPAFNCSDCWQLKAIVQAAEQEHAPVIIQTIPKVIATWPAEVLGDIGEYLRKSCEVPVFMHLDHSRDSALCKHMIDIGYDSVMIDGSDLPIEENAALCKTVSVYAGKKPVCIEGEVGRICGKNSESAYFGTDFLAEVDEAVYLAAHGGIDMLAVGIGNAHGFYAQRPHLNFARLHEIRAAVDLPLVLHGGSGIPDELLQKAIFGGISKVNIGTQLQNAYLRGIKKQLNDNDPMVSIICSMDAAVEAVREEARRMIRVCMANGTV